ncbi:MAG: RNA 3'-terminal phosphate cyclase [Candidatus Bathyarchaeota archaeon]|nr:RNA 3'-terminal phosphate cyclase [Candidatus Bathyarchaeota archaeon]
MLEIDGSKKSGSGTILRLSVALAAIKGEPLHIYNIRQNRPQVGLKPQHLESVLTAAKLCSAKIKGANIGSRELYFEPNAIDGGNIEVEIGTAGSIPMLFMSVLPICLFAEKPVQLHASKGGTDTLHAPTINYLRYVFLPLLRRMGVDAEIEVQKYGYYPKGLGEAILQVKPTKKLQPLLLEAFGQLQNVKGISVCTFLEDKKVAERQAKAARDYLSKEGLATDILLVNDKSNPQQKGSSITLWAQTDTGVILGADAIGEPGKPSEVVGVSAAQKLGTEFWATATVDEHLADMLIPYMALTRGTAVFLTRTVSEHLETNIWLTEKILNTKFNLKKVDTLYRIEKVG